jgi:hypothetical protein
VLREAAGILATSVALAPAAIVAQFADAASRRVLRATDMRAALEALGIAERPLAIERLLGGRSSAVYRLTLRRETVVLKCALAGGSLLAFGARLAGPQPYPADLSPAARIRREASALAILAAAGVRVPRVIAANPAARLVLLEHLDGEPLPATLGRPGAEQRIAGYARALQAAHAAGIVLGDAHPGNALVTAGGIALIDLEFAERGEDVDDLRARRAFDLAYAAQFLTPAERRIFLAGADDRVAVAAAMVRLRAPLFAYEMARQRAA